jgi:acylphosphatase
MGQASLHAIVHGHVQGVNFRHYTAREAVRLSLRGWVRNRPDGTVEVEAAGEPASLDALLNWLQKGPPAARVERVEATHETGTDLPPGFHITE